MAYAEYGLSRLHHEAEQRGTIRMTPAIRSLEDEIHRLRRTMELTYLQEATFNSEIVIEISRKLDVKINEYMQVRRQCIV